MFYNWDKSSFFILLCLAKRSYTCNVIKNPALRGIAKSCNKRKFSANLFEESH